MPNEFVSPSPQEEQLSAARRNPRCLDCGGRVWGGRCRACRRWQRVCRECGRPFTSVRRDARACGETCKLKNWRARGRDHSCFNDPRPVGR